MDVFPSPQPCAVGEVDKNQTENQYGLSYAAGVTSGNHSAEEVSKLELCPVSVENGIPTVEFTVEDVNSFTREEGLHQAVVIKFSYGKPALQELRQILPKHFEVKGCYSIGQLEYCHILVRFDLFEDFAKVVSRSSGYVQSKGDEFFFRTFPWTMGFNPREETSKAVVWISFPHLTANLFARKSLMSIASAVGKPITVDKATKDRTRPSTARVKVLINILDKHPNKIKIKIFDTKTGKMVENDQQIVIDNLPKYCTLCNHRDNDVKSCRWNTEDFNGKVPLSNETEGNYSLIESGRDARELLNEIKASRQSEMNSLSGKVLTAKQHVYVSNSSATVSFSSKNAMVAQQYIDNSSATLLEKSKNVSVPNAIVSDYLPRPNDLSADKRKHSVTHAHSLTVTDNAQQGNSSIRSKKIVPGELINVEPDTTKKTVEPDTTKKTVSLKSTSLAVFNNSIANSKFEIGSISGIKVLNAQQKYTAKQWRAVQPSRTNANADAVSDLSVSELQNPEANKIVAEVKIVQQNNEPMIGLTAVTDKLNLGFLKATETSKVSVVSQATKSVRAMKEVLDSHSMPAVNTESAALVLMAKDHATSSIQPGHLYDLAGQSDNMLSKLKDNVPMDTSNPAVILNAAKAAEVPQAAVQDRALKEVLGSHSSSIASENPDVNAESAASILMSKDHDTSSIHPGHLYDHFGQSDNKISKLKDTVPLDVISEEENITSHPAVIENMNAANSSNVAVVPQVADQESAFKEVLDSHPISTVSEKPSAMIGQSGNSIKMLSKVIATVPLDLPVEEEKNNTDHFVLTVKPKQKLAVSTTKDNPHKTGQRVSSRGLEYTHLLGSDHYGNLIDHSGQSNLLLSTSKSSVALVPVVNDNSEILANKKDAVAVSQTADPERANQTNTVALDTIAEDKQSSSHHGKDVAINTEHTENAAKQQKTRHHREDTDQSKSLQQNKSKLQQRAAEQEAKHAGKAAGRGIQKVRRYPPIYSGEEIFPFEISISSNKKEELSWDAVFSSLNSNALLFDTRNNAKVEHCQRERSWDGRMIEDVNIRRPPMRKAKQK